MLHSFKLHPNFFDRQPFLVNDAQFIGNSPRAIVVIGGWQQEREYWGWRKIATEEKQFEMMIIQLLYARCVL